jgi:hypothetical protein
MSNAKVRMYRQGLGDCFLVTLPRAAGKSYYIMIDCGVVLGTSNPADLMKAVVDDVVRTTEGHVDLLIATHEHWDHVSGFVQAKDSFSGLHIGELWLAWTEDPDDELGQKIRNDHQAMRFALASAAQRIRFGGDDSDSDLESLLGFFGAAGHGTTADAMEIVKNLCPGRIRFCLPADQPVSPDGVDARLYVLGPPRDEKALRKSNPSSSRQETYGMADVQQTYGDAEAPFDPLIQIPFDSGMQTPFFQEHYWGEASGSEQRDQAWRRIDNSWLEGATEMALQLDSATNNTSLVLAIELGTGDVLLFAGDAQVGNWLSWQNLAWQIDGKTVTGPDLLSRTVLYKTGHHGSHNATLRENGLETMKRLSVALIPVDQKMAIKKHWGKMPLNELESRLNEMTRGRVLRVDRDIPAALAGVVQHDPDKRLFYEVDV